MKDPAANRARFPYFSSILRWEARRVLLLGCAVLFVIAGFFSGARVTWSSIFSQTLYSGGTVIARLGDDLTIRPACATRVQIVSGLTPVYSKSVESGASLVWHVLGDDQYEIRVAPNCDSSVEISHPSVVVSPLLVGCCFFAALVLTLTCLTYSPRASASIARRSTRWEVAAWGVAAFLVFSVLPSYFHNDAVGQGLARNWGYRAWGYFDTIRAVGTALSGNGLLGLVDVQSFGKPIILPLAAWIVAPYADPYRSAPIISAIITATAVSGAYAVVRGVAGRAAGRIAAAILILDPLVLAYATSFYQEIAWVAGTLWGAYFLARAHRDGGRLNQILGYLFSALAVASKHPLTIPLSVPVVASLVLFQTMDVRYAVRVFFATAAIDTVASLALWPFLWRTPGFRVPMVLGARQTFDAVHGITLPIWQRAIRVLWYTFEQLTPFEFCGLVIAVAYAAVRRDKLIGIALVVMAVTLGFTLPTSLFLQHYILYVLPIVAAVCGIISSRLRINQTIALIVAIVAQGATAAAFMPYTATATLGCFSPACSMARGFAAEPVYGLREAATYIRAHASRDDVVLTLVAPHVLQAYLPEQQVLFATTFLPSRQEAMLIKYRPKYVVTTAYSDADGFAAQTPLLQLVRDFGARGYDARVYMTHGNHAKALPDMQQAQLLGMLPPRSRTIFIDDGAGVWNDGIPQVIQRARLFQQVTLDTRNLNDANVVLPRGVKPNGGVFQRRVGPHYDDFAFHAPMSTAVEEVISREATPFRTLKVMLSSASEARWDSIGVDLVSRAPIGAREATVGCVFGRSSRVALSFNGWDAIQGTITARDPVVASCLQRDAGLFIEVPVSPSDGKAALYAVAFMPDAGTRELRHSR